MNSYSSAFTYSKAGKIRYENSKVPDYLTYLNSDIVQNQKLNKEAEALVKKQQQEYDKRKKEFEENCLSGWDGSHRELMKW